MNRKIEDYAAFIFDCDGVLLDSNPVKTTAFYEVALPYGKRYAEELEAHHRSLGGVSRFEKMRYFLTDILGKEVCEDELNALLEKYGEIVKKKLIRCPETRGLRGFLDMIPQGRRAIVVSGGLGSEIRDVFFKRGISGYFSAIYGSPQSKEDIIAGEMAAGHLNLPAVFVGDSRYDHEVASKFGMDFVFVSAYSEFSGWKEYFRDKDVRIVSTLLDISDQPDSGDHGK